LASQIDEYGYILLDGQSGASGSNRGANHNNNPTNNYRSHKKTVIGWIVFFVTVGIIIAIIISIQKRGTEQTNQVTPATSTVTSTEEKLYIQDGFIFPDSDKRYLTEDEIATIIGDKNHSREEIIQYAINELYARHHYSFQTETWNDYYSSFSWYTDEGLSMEEAKAQFNAYEDYNLKLLVKEQKK